MRSKLTITSAILAASLLCGIACSSAGDAGADAPGASEDGGTDGGAASMKNLTVRWAIKGVNGQSDVCPTGYETVVVSAVPLTGTDDFEPPYEYFHAPFERRFPCAQGTATIALPTSGNATAQDSDCHLTTSACAYSPVNEINGRYFVSVHMTEASGENAIDSWPQYANPERLLQQQRADLTTGDKSLDVELYPSAAFIRLGWYLTAKSTGDELSCASASIDTIKVRGTLVTDVNNNEIDGGAPVELGPFPCSGQPEVIVNNGELGGGLSAALVPGSYKWEFTGFRAGVKKAERDMSVGDGSPDLVRARVTATGTTTKSLVVEDR